MWNFEKQLRAVDSGLEMNPDLGWIFSSAFILETREKETRETTGKERRATGK